MVVTENSWRERVMPDFDELEKIAVDVFGRDRVIKEGTCLTRFRPPSIWSMPRTSWAWATATACLSAAASSPPATHA